jgi:effector-binding domain-containing protein
MHKKMINLFIVLVVIVGLWSVWGFFASRVERADYTLVKKTNEYEIRNYGTRILAQTKVTGSYRESMGDGFRIVAGYIFGGNAKKESIAMTAPVTEQGAVSEKIAMTAPVLVGLEGEERIVSFSMPRSYTLETLPIPNDKRVKIVEVPAQKMAAIVFSGYRTDAKIEKMKELLKAKLDEDKVEYTGTFIYAGYNGPGTPPWMTRNEVMIEIK